MIYFATSCILGSLITFPIMTKTKLLFCGTLGTPWPKHCSATFLPPAPLPAASAPWSHPAAKAGPPRPPPPASCCPGRPGPGRPTPAAGSRGSPRLRRSAQRSAPRAWATGPLGDRSGSQGGALLWPRRGRGRRARPAPAGGRGAGSPVRKQVASEALHSSMLGPTLPSARPMWASRRSPGLRGSLCVGTAGPVRGGRGGWDAPSLPRAAAADLPQAEQTLRTLLSRVRWACFGEPTACLPQRSLAPPRPPRAEADSTRSQPPLERGAAACCATP